jgi:hypothetical protein
MTEDDQQNENPRGPLFALAAVVVIFVLGLLLFRTLYASRRLEDCLLSGRTNCAPIESPHSMAPLQRGEQARIAVALRGVALVGRVVQGVARGDNDHNDMIYAKTPEKIENDRVCLGGLCGCVPQRTLDPFTATIQATYDDLAPPVAAL